jgi:uncharacterized membrane protein
MKIGDSLADSFWFMPALMAFIAAMAALGLVALDHSVGSDWAQSTGWIWSGGASGARSVLSTVAGSVMTVVSIVFSLTISALAQTSSHFGPRVLRNFTSDRGVQFTLGTFISTFVYCLLVLRTVRSVEEASFVPYLAVNVGVFLALASLAVLIFFIHHISQSIQAENLVAKVGMDFQKSLSALFPEQIGESSNSEAPSEEVFNADHWQHAVTVQAGGNGYLQRIDNDRLMNIATRRDLQILLEKRPGLFTAQGTSLLIVQPRSHLTAKIEDELRDCFVLGTHRTRHQDILYSIEQLVEIAAHALSPGINEPYTALTCIDWIGASLRAVLERKIPSPLRYDDENQLRVVACPVSFGDIFRVSFDPLRLYGANNPDVMSALLNLITDISPMVSRDSDREELLKQIRLLDSDTSQISNESLRQQMKEMAQETFRLVTKMD